MGGSHRCGGSGGASTRYAEKVGIHIDNGRLTLNTDLLDLPEALGEFVIVHELVHLLAPNHGRVFKSFMSAYLPDWEERQHSINAYRPCQICLLTQKEIDCVRFC